MIEVPKDVEICELRGITKGVQEHERKRRMSAPYNASVETTDVDYFYRGRRLSDVHEQLIRLFSVHKVCRIIVCY